MWRAGCLVRKVLHNHYDPKRWKATFSLSTTAMFGSYIVWATLTNTIASPCQIRKHLSQ